MTISSQVASCYPQLFCEWAADRNLLKGATAKDQYFKLVSELGEWAGGVLTSDREEIIDGLGDVFVVSTIMAKQLGYDILPLIEATGGSGPFSDLNMLPIIGTLGDQLAKGEHERAAFMLGVLGYATIRAATRHGVDINTCLSCAWNDIKDRKGVMYKGIFIKSTDERYESAVAELAASV